jgi:hypothetical protein
MYGKPNMARSATKSGNAVVYPLSTTHYPLSVLQSANNES